MDANQPTPQHKAFLAILHAAMEEDAAITFERRSGNLIVEVRRGFAPRIAHPIIVPVPSMDGDVAAAATVMCIPATKKQDAAYRAQLEAREDRRAKTRDALEKLREWHRPHEGYNSTTDFVNAIVEWIAAGCPQVDVL